MIALRVSDSQLQSTWPVHLLICQSWTVVVSHFDSEPCHLVECGLATLPARTRRVVCASCIMFGIEVVAEAGSALVIGKFFLAQFAHYCAFIQVSTHLLFKTKISAHRTQQRLFTAFHFSFCVLCISITGWPGTRAKSNVPRCLECKNNCD